jgi:hypothetical protein
MRIVPAYFLFCALLTMFVLYIIYPNPRIIVKYPSVNDKISDIYVDDEGVCYRYHRKEIEPEKINIIPNNNK